MVRFLKGPRICHPELQRSLKMSVINACEAATLGCSGWNGNRRMIPTANESALQSKSCASGRSATTTTHATLSSVANSGCEIVALVDTYQL